jgi:lipopolysaccharide transport system ATP-binding protein
MNNAQHSTRNPQDEVLVRVEGVSKKFCRSLKKSLWYGLCDIASELNPRRSNELQAGGCKLEVANAQSATRNASEAGLLQPATANPQLPPPLRPGEFWAVDDVSFELRRGECLGLIGHNGAGKTTLLKMLNGLIKPDSGKITMRGRVGALIALGAGFNPILTGRPRRWTLDPRLCHYINGSVLGLTKAGSSAKIVFMAGCGCQNKCALAIRQIHR